MVSLPASWCARLHQSLQCLLLVCCVSESEWLRLQGLLVANLDVIPWDQCHLGPRDEEGRIGVMKITSK
ncbi:hypothetical protein NDU88_002830 [Pleurodeles waltl]|uniref:Secreted protein n=1 Tax=Pleurodeles waltl TaxID=8319 RepID=A0AAV7WRA6_PLEWA|nr:hypothetical protein NDU88_002830 [Pleurodeles waltl]